MLAELVAQKGESILPVVLLFRGWACSMSLLDIGIWASFLSITCKLRKKGVNGNVLRGGVRSESQGMGCVTSVG